MFEYKIDVLAELKKRDYSTYRLSKEKLLTTTTIQRLREKNTNISLDTLDTLCELLHCQASDIVLHIPDELNGF